METWRAELTMKVAVGIESRALCSGSSAMGAASLASSVFFLGFLGAPVYLEPRLVY